MTSPTTPVATPDFYDYDWWPLASATIDADFLVLRWPDDLELRAHGWWLRENVVTEGATDPVTREGTIDPAHHDDDLAVRTAEIDDQGAVHIEWHPDGFRGVVHPGWLRHVAEGRHRAPSWLPAHEPWQATTFTEPPTLPGRAVLTDDDALRQWLELLVRYGIARLADLPTDGETVLEVAGRVGPTRDTNFGPVWNVKAEIHANDENSTANTELRLGPHTDLPTREIPPGFQFLHCLENTCEGGWSRMTDGETVAAHLETEEGDSYEALTTLPWVFFNRSREHDHRWSGPIIDRGGPGSPLTIRAFYPLRAFPDMPEADVPRAYRAAKRFHELCADPRFQIGFPLRPGDLVAFDNRRVLHGRDAFDATNGRRHLRGCYVDQDEVHSRLRVLAREHETSKRAEP